MDDYQMNNLVINPPTPLKKKIFEGNLNVGDHDASESQRTRL